MLWGVDGNSGSGLCKICGKMCGKILKLLDHNKIWCGTRYGPCDYDSGDKKAKRQKGKNAKRQK